MRVSGLLCWAIAAGVLGALGACGDDDDAEPMMQLPSMGGAGGQMMQPGPPTAGVGGTAAGSGGSAANSGGSDAGGSNAGTSGGSGTHADSGTAGSAGQAGSAGSDDDDDDEGEDASTGSDDDDDDDDGEDASTGPDDDDDSDEVDGDGDPAWPPPPASDELADLPGQLAMGICDAIASCLGPTLSTLALDGADCVARTAAEIEDGDFVYMQASIDAGRLVFDPAAVAQCVDEYGALACDLVASRPPASCKTALKGQVPTDGACVLDDDCAGAAFCDRSAACPGACKALLAAGGTCDRNDQCQAGLECLSGKCGASALAGAACGGDVAPECHLGLVCIGEDRTANMPGDCRTKASLLVKAAGEPCDAAGGTWCQEGLACVVDDLTVNGTPTLTQVCRAKVGSGQACNTSLVPQQCPAGEYCPADLDPEYEASCAVRPGDGQPCGVFNTCAPDLVCDGTTCRPIRRRIGAACSADSDCLTRRCVLDAGGGAKHCLAFDRCRLDPPDEPDPTCGDTVCGAGETCESCPLDCDECPPEPECGDDACNGDETCSTCPDDCGVCPPRCGDATCNGGETCSSCAGDCGACPPACGDGACNGSETCGSCAQDCGVCPPVCGDDTCEARESCETCADDCGACPAPYSGPCDDESDCAPSQTCKKQSVGGLFPASYGNCAEPCDAAGDCSGRSGQRTCGSDGSCALLCSVLECVLFNQDRCCPVGMECVEGICNWLR